jgi:hypothetical protein
MWSVPAEVISAAALALAVLNSAAALLLAAHFPLRGRGH